MSATEDIFNAITKQLEEGVVPWHKPWVASGVAGALLEIIEKRGDIVVLDKEHAAAMLMPFTLAASELLNTEPFK